MKKSTICFVLTLIFVLDTAKTYCQIINGDFENTTLTGCNYNLDNSVFTSAMSGCTGFGANNELDIQNGVCYGTAPSGSTFISLAVEVGTLLTDQVTLSLAQPLIAGNTYSLSFYMKADTTFGTQTADSLEIGLSNTSNQFGQKIAAFWPDKLNWASVSFFFTAVSASGYISLQNQGAQYGWVFVDDFVLNNETGINSIDPGLVAVNFANGILHITAPVLIYKLTLIDFSGKEIYTSSVLSSSSDIFLPDVNNGVYFVRLFMNNGTTINKRIAIFQN